MACPNITSPEWESLVSTIGVENAWREFFKYGVIPDSSIYDVQEPVKPTATVKPGVDELFSSNPELANQVYEALGYNLDRTLDDRNNIIKAYKDKSVINLKTSLLQDLLEFDRTKDETFYSDKEETGTKNIQKLKESIKKEGLKEPLELVINSQGAVVLGEGNHRFQALKQLGYTEIPVIVKGRGSKDEYFTEMRGGKLVKLGLNLNKDFNTQITPQQEQQAKQLYSQYLDTIFPDSKVKDIVYHGSNTKFDKFNKSNLPDSGIYFDKNKTTAYEYGSVLIPAILNSSGYYYGGNVNRVNSKQIRENGETGLTNGSGNIVFEPEQIHILGSKQDIGGFKEFVGNTPKKEKGRILYSIKTKTTAQLAKGINKELIKSQNEIKYVRFIQALVLNKIGDVTPNKVLKVTPAQAFASAKSNFEAAIKNVNDFIELIKTPEKFNLLKAKDEVRLNNVLQKLHLQNISSFEEAVQAGLNYKEIVDNFDKYEDYVIAGLLKKGLKIKKDKNKIEKVDLQDIENSNQDNTEDSSIPNEEMNPQRFDATIFEVNPYDTATIRVRALVQTIKTGEYEFGIPLYADPNDVMDDMLYAGVAMNLSGFNEKDSKLENFISALEQRQEGRPYIKELIAKIRAAEQKGDWAIVNQILTFASKAFANEEILLYTLRKSGNEVNGVSGIKIIGGNRDTVIDQIKRDWLSKHEISDFYIKKADGTRIPNPEKVEELNRIRKEGELATGDAQKQKFIEYFKVLGIPFTIKDMELIAPKVHKIFRKGKDFKVIFTDKNLLDNIYNDFKKNLEVPFEGQYGFQNEGREMGYLAQLYFDATPNIYKAGSSKTADGKTKYLYIQTNNVEISKREFENTDGVTLFNTALAKPNSSEKGFWKKVKQSIAKFILGYFNGSREQEASKEGKVRKNYTNKEQIFTMLAGHQADMREGTYITFTLSDKTTSMQTKMTKEFFVDAEKIPVGLTKDYVIKDNEIIFKDSFKDRVYNSFVEPEISRILASIKYGDSVNIENFQISSKLFYFIPKLNSDPSLEAFRKDLYSGKYTIEDLNTKYAKTVADVVINEFKRSSEDEIAVFKKNGIIKVEKNKYSFLLYKDSYVNRFRETGATGTTLAMLMSMDMKFNYTNSQIKTIQFLKFDPAHAFKAFKGFKADSFENISPADKLRLAKTTWDEFSKRAAALIAPGSQGSWSWKYDIKYTADGKIESFKTHGAKQTYRAVTLKDVKKTNDFSTKSFETTDAQEFVTMQEHIDYLMSEGRIPLQTWESIHNKINKAGKGGYYELSKEELGYVLSPVKPVHTGSVKEGDDSAGLYRYDYVKSSRYPLIPQHEVGSERDKLRIWMEKNDVQSANFGSGKKLGRPSLSLEIFDKDNNFIEPVNFDKAIQELSRDGLRNQQEIPAQKSEISTVTQMNRTLFDGLLESTFDFSGMSNVSGKQMKAIKEAIRAKLFDIQADRLRDKIGDLHTTNEGLYNLLKKTILEDTTGSYTLNDLRSLKLNKQGMFEIPLEVQFKYPKFQGLINSMINKNVMLKVDGTSFVQVSGVGAKYNLKDLGKNVKSDIIWTDTFAKTFEKGGQPKLEYIRKDKNGVVKPAQVIVSQYLRDEKDNLIDLNDFITEKNGIKILDTSRLSPKLLQLVASRIPNQSHVSTLPVEVVGFLPSYMENTMIVPDGITGQMGSDFDVDKLFAYTSKFKYSGKTGTERLGANETEYNQLVESAKKMAEAAGEKANKKGRFNNFNKYLADAVKEKYGDKEVPKFKVEKPASITLIDYELNSIDDVKDFTEDQLAQVYRDMHWNVLTHPDTFEKIVKSVDMEEVSDKVEMRRQQLEDYGIVIDEGANLPLDYMTSIKRFNDNKSGKDGVSIYANLISAQADMQDKPLRLGKINKETNKEEENPLKIRLNKSGKIVDLLYVGKTGESISFLNEKRSISDNLNIQFTESVDNAKNQFLREFNWDNKSMGAMGMLSMLTDQNGQAVPIEFMMDLTSQSYIYELLEKMDLKQDSFGTYERDALNKSVVELQDEIEELIDNKKLLKPGVKANTYLTDENRDNVLDPQTLADMWLVGKALESGQNDDTLKRIASDLKFNSVNDMLLNYYTAQYDSLVLFERLNNLGRELMTMLGSMYTYTKGIGPTVFSAKQKLNQLNKLSSSENFLGISELAGIIEKNEETGLIQITPVGELGSSISNSLIEAQRIYGYLFPIAAGKNLEDLVSTMLDGMGLNIEQIGRQKYESVFNTVFKASIHYLYTNPDLELFENVRDTRDRLINGENSLARRIEKLKQNPIWAKNGFLKNLQTDPVWKSDVQTISFRSPFGTEKDEDAIELGFYELTTYDGENKEEIRELARDLALYVYATGDAGNIGKFIPIDYVMSDKEFARGIRRIRGTYAANINNDEYRQELIDQIVQNNADEFSKKFSFYSSENSESKFKTLLKKRIGNVDTLANVSGFTITRGDFKDAESIVNALTIPLSGKEVAQAIKDGLDPYKIDENDKKVLKAKYPSYILITDSFVSEYGSEFGVNDRNVRYLYKRTSKALNAEGDATYERINILGVGNIKEYDSDVNNKGLKSVIKNNDVDTIVDPAMYSENKEVVEQKPVKLTSNKVVADVPQNKVSGVESYGSTVTANAEAIKALGSNPHSIDMIEAGFRTRTTRSETEMAKYAVKVGDIIKHFGKSADGTTKEILARVTAIHPKGSEGWKGTWAKEGWRAEDVDVIDRFKDGAAAIEFEVIKPEQTSVKNEKVLEGDIFSLSGIPVITTNLGGVHGAGLAQAANAKGLIQKGDGAFKATNEVVQLPVKKVWSDNMAMNNNMELLKESLRSLIKVARENPTKNYLLPLAGLGHGEGSVEEIMPLLIKTAQASPNISLVLPGEGVDLGRQGTVRKDYTRENMPQIKDMLSKAGLLATQPSTGEKQTDFGEYKLHYFSDENNYDVEGPEGIEAERLSYEEGVAYIEKKQGKTKEIIEDKPVEPTIVNYKNTNYIVEGTIEEGDLNFYYQKGDGSKGELVKDKGLDHKLTVQHEADIHSSNVVELTDLQHSPKYLVSIEGQIYSLTPSNFGKEITSDDIYKKVMSVYKNENLTPTKDEPVASNPQTTKYQPNYIEINGKKIETFKWDKNKKIAIKLTKDQDKAVRMIVNHFEKTRDLPFILKGKAGTGKTTVIRVINEYFKNKSSVIITPTHKAGKNASLVTYGNTQSKYRTFASAYYSDRSTVKEDVIIFDEVSMLNDSDLEILKRKLKPGKMVIFMGDERQLPPVKGEKTSPFFNSKNEKNIYELTEIMRFDEQGSIFKIADRYAENLKKYSVIKQFPEKLISEKDAVYSVDSSKRLVDSYIHFYRMEGNDPSKVRLIAYGNKTAELYNNQIRNIIYRGDAKFNIINNNDLLVGNLGWSTKNVLESPMVNSSEYKVVEEPKTVTRNYDNYSFTGQNVTYKEIVGGEFEAERTITVVDPEKEENKDLYKYIATTIANFKRIGKSYESFYNDVLNKIEKSGIYSLTTMYAKPTSIDPKTKEILSVDLFTLDQMLKKIKEENPKLSEDEILNMIDNEQVKEYYKIEPNLSFGYAITTHKSQGSTYKHVMVDEHNMSFRDNTRLVDDQNDEFFGYEANQMRYVGFSRATTTLVIYTKKPIGEKLIYEEDNKPLSEEPPINLGGNNRGNLNTFFIKAEAISKIFGPTNEIQLSTKEILNNLYKNSDSLNKQILSLIGETGGVGQLKIVIDETIENPGEYTSSDNTIRINPELAISNDAASEKDAFNQLSEVIMHELLHNITTTLLNVNPIALSAEQRKWVTSLKNLFKTTQEKLLNDPKHAEALKAAIEETKKKDGVLSKSDKSMYYGLTSVDEFVSMLMTDNTFRNFMNEVKFEGNKSILDRFIEVLGKILEALGVKVKEDSVLQEGVTSIVGLVQSRRKADVADDGSQRRSIATETPKGKLINENFESIINTLNIKSEC